MLDLINFGEKKIRVADWFSLGNNKCKIIIPVEEFSGITEVESFVTGHKYIKVESVDNGDLMDELADYTQVVSVIEEKFDIYDNDYPETTQIDVYTITLARPDIYAETEKLKALLDYVAAMADIELEV